MVVHAENPAESGNQNKRPPRPLPSEGGPVLALSRGNPGRLKLGRGLQAPFLLSYFKANRACVSCRGQACSLWEIRKQQLKTDSWRDCGVALILLPSPGCFGRAQGAGCQLLRVCVGGVGFWQLAACGRPQPRPFHRQVIPARGGSVSCVVRALPRGRGEREGLWRRNLAHRAGRLRPPSPPSQAPLPWLSAWT